MGFMCIQCFGLGMHQLTTPEPISQSELRREIREATPGTSGDYDGITANPFGDVSTQTSHRNEMHQNSATWPEVTLWDEEIAGTFKPAQHFENARTTGDVIQVGAYLADTIITANDLSDDIVTHFVTDKIAEGFAYRIGVIETVVEQVVEAELGWTVEKHTLAEVAENEGDGIDIERVNGEVYNVKFENGNSTKDGVGRIDVTENDGMLEIEVEE